MKQKQKRKKESENRGHNKPQEKYHPSIPAKTRTLIVECGLVNIRGDLAVGRLAKLLDISIETLRRWRSPLSEYYKPAFAKAIKDGNEAISSDNIKRSMIQRAEGYTRTKKTFELRGRGKKKRLTETKREIEKIIGDPNAAKLVLPNIGPPDERWKNESVIEHQLPKIEIEITGYGK